MYTAKRSQLRFFSNLAYALGVAFLIAALLLGAIKTPVSAQAGSSTSGSSRFDHVDIRVASSYVVKINGTAYTIKGEVQSPITVSVPSLGVITISGSISTAEYEFRKTGLNLSKTLTVTDFKITATIKLNAADIQKVPEPYRTQIFGSLYNNGKYLLNIVEYRPTQNVCTGGRIGGSYADATGYDFILSSEKIVDYIVTPTPTATATSTATATATSTNTPTATATATDIPTSTPTATATSTNTPTATATATDVPTATPTATATATDIPTSTPTATATATDVPTATPTATDVSTATPTATDVPTATPTATDVPTATPTATDIPTATPTATDVPTATPTATDLPTATPTSTDVPTATPTNTPEIPGITVTPSETPVTPDPTGTPEVPQVTPTVETPEPTEVVPTLPPPPAVTQPVLIPVTGADNSGSALALGMLQKLLIYLGAGLLGIGLVLAGISSRMTK